MVRLCNLTIQYNLLSILNLDTLLIVIAEFLIFDLAISIQEMAVEGVGLVGNYLQVKGIWSF